jgi:hypothetical protein
MAQIELDERNILPILEDLKELRFEVLISDGQRDKVPFIGLEVSQQFKHTHSLMQNPLTALKVYFLVFLGLILLKCMLL